MALGTATAGVEVVGTTTTEAATEGAVKIWWGAPSEGGWWEKLSWRRCAVDALLGGEAATRSSADMTIVPPVAI